MMTLQEVLKSFQTPSTRPACTETAATWSANRLTEGATGVPSASVRLGAGGLAGAAGRLWLFVMLLMRDIPGSCRTLRITLSPGRKPSKPLTVSSS